MATPSFGGIFFTSQSQDESRRIISRVSLGQAGTTGSFQRFVKVVDSQELVYDSCLPDYSDMLSTVGAESGYYYNGNPVLRYSSNNSGLFEQGDVFDSSIVQFPFENNPKRKIQKVAAVISTVDTVEIDALSDPPGLTGRVLDDASLVFRARYAFISRSPGAFKPDYTESFFPIGFPGSSYNVSDGLVSSYFSLDDNSGGTFVDGTGLGNDLDLTPTLDGTTHPIPTDSTDVPVPNLIDDGSLLFVPTGNEDTDNVIAATTNRPDHSMVGGIGQDLPFSLSVTFKLTNLNKKQVLIERARRRASNTILREYELFVDSTNRIEFHVYSSDGTSYKGISMGLDSVKDDKWYNVIVTYGGDKNNTVGLDCLSMYLNGKKIKALESSSSPSSGQMFHSTFSRLWIGAGGKDNSLKPRTSSELDGNIHSVHIWKNSALTNDQAVGVSSAELDGVSIGVIKNRTTLEGISNYDGALRAGTYRYGISNVNQEFSSSRFMSNRYGQFRDVLEHRNDTAFVGIKPPVKCRFISGSNAIAADLTHAQNISTFATSSLPYFDDGIARNRPDDPDAAFSI
jgi:hypothetical protein